MPAVLNIADLVRGDNPAQYCRRPVIIRSDHCSALIVQFQCRISQRVRDSKRRQLRTNGTNDHSLWPTALHNETANHHVVASLNEAARADVTQPWRTGLRLAEIVADSVKIDALRRCHRHI